MASIVIEGIAKRFGADPVLDRVGLSIASGEMLAVLGASGSGKTTLLRLIAGFETVDAGSITIDGVMMSGPGVHVKPERRRIGYLAQEGALFPHLSVAGNIGFGLVRDNKDRGDHAKRIAQLLDMVGLPTAFATRSPHQLSGGEQQRVALARSLATAPQVVLLDEPFSALDAARRQDVRHTVAAVLKQAGATAILVTHDQAEALSMGDRIAVLRQGVIVQHAAPTALYHRPADALVAQFVGEAVLLAGCADGLVADCALGRLALATPMRGPVRVMIRPEQIALVAAGTPGSVPAEIGAVHYFGHDALVALRLIGIDAPPVLARVFSHRLPEPGDRLGLCIEGVVAAFAESALV